MGFPLVRLDSLYNIARGGSPRPIKDFITNEPDGINWIKIGDATASGKYIFETKQKIIPAGIQRSRLVKEGDFILSNSMSFGRPYIMATSGCIHDGWLVLSAKDDSIDQDFLYYILGSPFVFKQFDALAAGSTVRNLNINLVSGVKIPLLPIHKQKRIVAILDQAFAEIDCARTNVQQNLNNARELFESYLQQVFSPRGDGWVETTLEACCKTTQGVQIPKSNQSAQFKTGYRRYLYISDFDHDKNIKYVEDIHSKKVVTIDDLIVVNTGASSGKIFMGIDGVLSNNLFRVTFDIEVFNKKFLYYFVASSLFKDYQARIVKGTANPHMGHENFKSTPFSYPRIDEQTKIVNKVEECSIIIEILEKVYSQKLIALDELKKSILQKAFSGELSKEVAI